ncbi:hypothetical protein JMJ77_0007288 [Colletotrichum scovillei]|uniref:Uncharacterized protein n=1 Tax=Colletotrichum scovillei TaxID=1209932 RepID=A0A9P7RFU1_9PEZI|nr:hypothetical protein JMJ77_0007288 [Colletotrichum scovillei]KAG7074222.1 hypothetical protein JMJ76_0010706 [Colletotrichum scovillei]KAG7081308.1 hypothetical protein JMJ78_0003432 [Colletotrichum scovillei]
MDQNCSRHHTWNSEINLQGISHPMLVWLEQSAGLATLVDATSPLERYVADNLADKCRYP